MNRRVSQLVHSILFLGVLVFFVKKDLAAQPPKNSMIVKFEDCEVWKTADTITLGNNKIARRFLWNGGNLISIDLLNKETLRNTVFANPEPDFYLPAKMLVEGNGVLQTIIHNQTNYSERRLEVIIITQINKLQVKRVFRIYPGCPAIACDYYYKGSMETTIQPRISSPGDLVNVENISEMNKDQLPMLRLDRLGLQGNHWKVKTVQFFDITDRHTTTVKTTDQLAYIFSNQTVGNLLLMNNLLRKEGLFWLKEAPSPSVQLSYPGFDFSIKTGSFQLTGAGISATDISTEEWTRGYGFVVGVSDGTEYDQLKALRTYQNKLRRYIPYRDDMIMMNTWGERGEGENLNELFALNEIEKASAIGIGVFQLDAGWYQGGTKNMDSFWLPHSSKFPNGLMPLVKAGKKKNVELSLWYEPDPENDYGNWQRDASIVTRLHQQFGINIYKIDGVQIVSKSGEVNFRKLLDKVLQDTDNNVFFNIDITAGRRNGFHYFNEYGNFFLENRYTDWGNYYPYQTLRNAWLLSRYIPLQKLLIEFLNNERNQTEYATADSLAPGHTSFEYSFATTIMAQPLAWIEAHRLSKNQMAISKVVNTYRKYQHDIHMGDIYPIGNEPDGYSWTGFQSMQQNSGYITVYRERSEAANYTMQTWFKPGTKVSFTPILGMGKPFVTTAAEGGRINFHLPLVNSYSLYRYKILN